jgi:hypothetical protein
MTNARDIETWPQWVPLVVF